MLMGGCKLVNEVLSDIDAGGMGMPREADIETVEGAVGEVSIFEHAADEVGNAKLCSDAAVEAG